MVSIHAPAWGATAAYFQPAAAYVRFNPRSRVGSDSPESAIVQKYLGFNPRSRVGSDEVFQFRVICQFGFNPRSRVGSDYAPCVQSPGFFLFQSTLPRGERPAASLALKGCIRVSIHAPAWGATCCHLSGLRAIIVSIHAPAWGATASMDMQITCTIVSIHAPAWGATTPLSLPRRAFIVSIHAPAWGATQIPSIDTLCHNGFNPRSRVGSDFSANPFLQLSYGFNPRSRVGSDFIRRAVKGCEGVSIHAPAWGATLAMRCLTTVDMFQSTLPRGERPGAACVGHAIRKVSIHAPAWGATLQLNQNFDPSTVSIHAPAWGATFVFEQPYVPGLCFNPRSRVGSDLRLCSSCASIMLFQSTLPRGERRTDTIYAPLGR